MLSSMQIYKDGFETLEVCFRKSTMKAADMKTQKSESKTKNFFFSILFFLFFTLFSFFSILPSFLFSFFPLFPFLSRFGLSPLKVSVLIISIFEVLPLNWSCCVADADFIGFANQRTNSIQSFISEFSIPFNKHTKAIF